MAGCYALMGRREEARKMLENMIAYSKENYVLPVFIACVFVALGEKDQTFAWLEKAFRERDPWLLMYLKSGHTFDAIRSDPRYAALLRRIGLEK